RPNGAGHGRQLRIPERERARSDAGFPFEAGEQAVGAPVDLHGCPFDRDPCIRTGEASDAEWPAEGGPGVIDAHAAVERRPLRFASAQCECRRHSREFADEAAAQVPAAGELDTDRAMIAVETAATVV